MDIILLSLAAFIASVLTFFSGFGLGTLLTPVMLIFFPVELAIALTGVVHLFNNLYKIILVGRHANVQVIKTFGIPAVLASVLGAWILVNFPVTEPVHRYSIMGKEFEVFLLKLLISLFLIFFALTDVLPYFKKLQFGKSKLAIGGFFSGFFGGLSGNQGALRSAFLIKMGLSKEAFVGTAVVVSTMVDFTRLGVYFSQAESAGLFKNTSMVVSAIVAAIFGSYFGNRALKKVSLMTVQWIVAVLLILISIALGLGWV